MINWELCKQLSFDHGNQPNVHNSESVINKRIEGVITGAWL